MVPEMSVRWNMEQRTFYTLLWSRLGLSEGRGRNKSWSVFSNWLQSNMGGSLVNSRFLSLGVLRKHLSAIISYSQAETQC